MRDVGRGVRLLSLWGPVVLWMALIFVVSAMPQLPTAPQPLLDTILKKAAHAGEYFVLGLLVCRALGVGAPGLCSRRGLASVALGVLYAASDEVHQVFVPGRNPSAVDLAVDAAGLLAGSAAWAFGFRGPTRPRFRSGGLRPPSPPDTQIRD